MVTVVQGVVKDYAWGIVDGLAPWCGGSTGRPQAELWFGAHRSAPSPVVSPAGVTGETTLVDIFEDHEIPILVKLLAAAQPLSVQVHPRADHARRRWSDQQANGGPQILADGNEKTELIVAIEPFEAFVGWRPDDEAVAILSRIPNAVAGAKFLATGDRIAAIRALLAAEGIEEAVALLPDASKEAGLPAIECAAYETVASTYPGDKGALLTALLAHVSLDVGSAAYVPAGVPHSYIRGLGLEVMTTSDNVLRLGLTPKPIFIEEALEALDLGASPQVLHRRVGEIIAPPGAPFEALLARGLTGIHEHAAQSILRQGRFRLCLAIEGAATITTDTECVVLNAGMAAIIPHGDSAARVSASGLVALVAGC